LPILACLIVFGAPQMADMMAGMRSSLGGTAASNWRALELGVGVALLGLQSWFWARAERNARLGHTDAAARRGMSWQERAAPRLILIPTTAIAISPLIFACLGKIPLASVPLPAVFVAVVVSGILWAIAVWQRVRQQRQAPVAAPVPLGNAPAVP